MLSHWCLVMQIRLYFAHYVVYYSCCCKVVHILYVVHILIYIKRYIYYNNYRIGCKLGERERTEKVFAYYSVFAIYIIILISYYYNVISLVSRRADKVVFCSLSDYGFN